MARPRPSRMRSDWTIDTITVDPLPSNEVPEEEFDNELTLTSDDILKVQKSPGFYLNFSDELNNHKQDIKEKATWAMAKQVLKAAFAYWLAFLVDLIVPIMHTVGSSTFLAIVMVCYFQPSRTFGALSESAAWGIVGAVMASLWSLIGIVISNILREDEVYYTPSTIMNLIFLAIGTFILSYDKIKWPPMRFGSINAIIIMSFSLTQSYIRPHTEFNILKSLLIPMIIGPTCSVIANLLLWPENATTNYIPYMHETLQSFIDLLDQETHFFLRDAYNRNTISQLNRAVQDNLQNLDNAKREAQHEISFSKIGPEDLIEINRLMKTMYMTLGGLALSGVIEEELMKDGQEGTIEIRIEDNNECESIFDQAYSFDDDKSSPHSPTNTIGTLGKEEDLTKLLYILRPICTELSEACQLCLADCISRVDHFQHNCCDPWYKKWWPFYRKSTSHHYQNVVEDPLQLLQLAMVKFNDARQEGLNYLFENQETISPSPQRIFLLLLLFENNLKVFSENLGFLVGLIKILETKRLSKRLWMPSIPFLKRIKNIGESDEDGWKVVEPQNEEAEEDDLFGSNYCDPDVTPPVTTSQKFWYQLWKIRNWFNSKYARFAFKNSLVVTCLSIPAFLPHTSELFDNYRGQWALISAVLSFSPTTGGAVLQFFGRLIGSGVGALMAIISWEITRGNASNGLGNPTTTVFTIAAMVRITL
ncbi:7751_t:CDS:2 [Diversispora eburnea]|uniref:7751_t:CDS:1 n=1 Tax=Diversispora eburnea TaxID=1213867 RepID=A0A9N9B5T9_9GLOM|nr:7751_t:CDS:2 [Diversispora eburnea]